MDFEKWWESEGSVMFDGDSSAKNLAHAAWNLSKQMLEGGTRVLNDPTIPEKTKTWVRIEMKNQRNLMKRLELSNEHRVTQSSYLYRSAHKSPGRHGYDNDNDSQDTNTISR